MDLQYVSHLFGKYLQESCSPHGKCIDDCFPLMKVELCSNTALAQLHVLKLCTLLIPLLHVHIAVSSLTTTVLISY